MRPRAFYVVGRADQVTGFLAGPFPSVQEAWGTRGAVLRALAAMPGPDVTLASSGVAMLESANGGPFPPGAMNDQLARRYWADTADRLYCTHGPIEGNLCVDCERKDMQ